MTSLWRVAVAKSYPRSGERWSMAEDRKLRRLVRKHVAPKKCMRDSWWRVAKALGRTPLGVQTRWQILKTVDVHAKANSVRKHK